MLFFSAASCPADEEGQIKLINGNSPLNGRVEICIDGLRGTICDQRWGRREAVVVCRQLGHSIFRKYKLCCSYARGLILAGSHKLQ